MINREDVLKGFKLYSKDWIDQDLTEKNKIGLDLEKNRQD